MWFLWRPRQEMGNFSGSKDQFSIPKNTDHQKWHKRELELTGSPFPIWKKAHLGMAYELFKRWIVSFWNCQGVQFTTWPENERSRSCQNSHGGHMNTTHVNSKLSTLSFIWFSGTQTVHAYFMLEINWTWCQKYIVSNPFMLHNTIIILAKERMMMCQRFLGKD